MYLKCKQKINPWFVSSRADAAAVGARFCVTASWIPETPRAPAFAAATGRKGLGAIFDVRDCKEMQVARIARVDTLIRKSKIVDQSQRSGSLSKTKHGNGGG